MTGTELATIAKDAPANTIDPMPPKPVSGQVIAPMRRMGVPGYTVTGGYILPTEVDRLLSRRELYRLYEQNLVNVTIIGTAVRYILELIGDAEWNFKPADESDEAKAIADFVEDALGDMETSFARVMRGAAGYKLYGFSLHEWILKGREDGKVGFANIERRPQVTIERWDIDTVSGRPRGVYQRNPNNGAELYLPMQKLLYVHDDVLSDNPEGLGLYRHTVRTAAGIARFEDLEHWGFETDLRGVPVGRAPYAHLDQLVEDGAISEAERANAIAAITNFITNHIRGPNTGVVLDSSTYRTTDEKGAVSSSLMWDVELLKAEGSSHAQIDMAIKRKTQELARLFGVEHLLLGSDGAGSLALATQSTKRLHGMVNSTLKELREVTAKQLIPVLMKWNNIPRALWPKPQPEEIAYRTIEEVTGALANMATAGVPLMPGDPAVDAVRDMMGLPRTDPALADMQLLESALLTVRAGQPQAAPQAGGGKPKGEGSGKPGSKPSGARQGAQPAPAKPLDISRELTTSMGQLRSYLKGARA